MDAARVVVVFVLACEARPMCQSPGRDDRLYRTLFLGPDLARSWAGWVYEAST